MAGSLGTVLVKIDSFSTPEHLDKLHFLAQRVLPLNRVERSKSVGKLQQELETLFGRNSSIILTKRFLETVGLIRLSRELEKFIEWNVENQDFPDVRKLCLCEILIMVSDELGDKSFSRLKDRIPPSLLGGHSDNIRTEIELFKRLLQQQTLSVDTEQRSLDLLCEWLDDIGRKDIVQKVRQYPRIEQEQGGICRVGTDPAPFSTEESTTNHQESQNSGTTSSDS